jgi:hypothetical protein
VRGANFTKKEDEALCIGWRSIGINPITRTKKHNSFNECIHEKYKLHSKWLSTQVSLKTPPATIDVACLKYSCCLAQVSRLNPSGVDAEDKVCTNSRCLFIFEHLLCSLYANLVLLFVAHHCSKFNHGKTEEEWWQTQQGFHFATLLGYSSE